MMDCLSALFAVAYCRINAFLFDEDGAVDIVAIVVLIGIAILLAVIFKDQITNLLNDLFDTINQNASDAIS